MKKPLSLLIFSLVISYGYSQSLTGKSNVLKNMPSSLNTAQIPEFSSSDDARKLIKDIMDVVGLTPDFIIKAANVPNVQAEIRHHKRYIIYNPGFIKMMNTMSKDKWTSVFILAHEIGHHLDGHTILKGSRPPQIELEADEFSGFVLNKLGATLEQSKLALSYIAKPEASKTHPGRGDRIEAVEIGWNKGQANNSTVIKF